MSLGCPRSLCSVCEFCSNKIQTVADMLLISCCVKPVWTDAIMAIQTDDIRGVVMSYLKDISVISQNLITHVHMISTKWTEVSSLLHELSTIVIEFMEIICHLAYLISVSFPNCTKAEDGLVNRYAVCYSGLEIKLSCTRLKRTRIDELSPQIIIDLCSNISKHIAVMTDICRKAGNQVNDESVEDQFKLSVKSVTCAAGCLIASIKSYKAAPNLTHHSRVMVFCEPVLSSSQALVFFATEKSFTGAEGILTEQATEIHKRILGSCNNIVSACVALCKTIRDLTYDMMTTHHRERLRFCTESIERGSDRLLRILDGYDISMLYKEYKDKVIPSKLWRENSFSGSSDVDSPVNDSVSINNCHDSSPQRESLPSPQQPTEISSRSINSESPDLGYSPDHLSNSNSTSFSGSENSCHSDASR